ncbi:MAG TPA: ribbon-helix-helix domain-containing protein [Pirellulales bacterium]|nr:ribbon-helix-helix domain-containing protein [Pirellulales bacterium]
MASSKVAISIDSSLLSRLDELIARRVFPNRSKAIQAAVEEKLQRLNRTQLAIECAKLDPAEEKRLAELGLEAELERWPAY